MKKINVGIDVTSLMYGRGVSFYTSNLTRALLRQNNITLSLYATAGRGRRRLEYEIAEILMEKFTATQELHPSANGRYQIQELGNDAQVVIQKIPPKLNYYLWHRWHTNHLTRFLPEIDVFHSWDYQQPPDENIPLVSTIHDLAILKYPHTAKPEILRHHQESWAILKKRHAHIIAVSQQTKSDLINILDWPEKYVHVVYEALPSENMVPLDFLTPRRISLVRREYGIDRDYILFVGTREPRKNLERLVQAWQPYSSQVDLVLVGAQGWDTHLCADPCLKVLPRLDKIELALLYRGAKLLVYPSLDEGFGLPILEAFAYDTPVLTSVHTATQEVAGEAAVLVNPESIDAIANGLEKLLRETPAAQKERQKKMAAQLKKFSWDKAARETIKVYRQALKEATC